MITVIYRPGDVRPEIERALTARMFVAVSAQPLPSSKTHKRNAKDAHGDVAAAACFTQDDHQDGCT